MYKLLITKYKHTSNNNYFDNTYSISNNPSNIIRTIQLNTLANNYDILYYQWKTIYSTVWIEIFSDSSFTTKIGFCEAVYVDTGFPTSRYMIIIPYNNSGLEGGLLAYLDGTAIQEFNGNIETNAGVIDWFEISQLPTDFISSLSEELFNNDNKYVASDYQINLSNIIDEKSHFNKSVFDFFENEDEYIYRVIFQKDNRNIRVGFIDYSSMNKNSNNNNEGQLISFDVFSAEKEIMNFMDTLMFQHCNVIPHIAFSFDALMLKIAFCSNVNLLDTVNIDSLNYSINGYYPEAKQEFYRSLFDKSLKDIFIGLCKSLGIMFKINTDNLSINSYDKMTLKLFFKSEGTQIQNIQVIAEAEGNKGLDNNYTYWGIKTAKKINDNNNTAECYDILIGDGVEIKHLPDVTYKYLQYVPRQVSEKAINGSDIYWIDVSMYDNNEGDPVGNTFHFSAITPLRIFNHLTSFGYYDYPESIFKCVTNQYNYFLSCLKKTKTLFIVFTDFFDITLYNKFPYKNRTWLIEKIDNIDIINQTAQIEVVEE